MNIGNAIKELRNEKKLSQDQLAALADITQSALSNIEKGRKKAHPTTLEKISKALGVPLSLIYVLALEKEEIPLEKQALYDGIFPAIKSLIMQIAK